MTEKCADDSEPSPEKARSPKPTMLPGSVRLPPSSPNP